VSAIILCLAVAYATDSLWAGVGTTLAFTLLGALTRRR